MTVTQTDKANQFRALHEAPDAFVIANVWDGGSARMMAGLGSRRWPHRAAPRRVCWAGVTAE
jgi:hypothetical protein